MGRDLGNDARYIYRITRRHIPKEYYLYNNLLLMYVLMLVNLKWINSIVKHFIMGYVGAIQLLHKYEQGLEHIILILFISVHFRAKWLLYVPPGLTLKNSTFCPHNGFMCFVWI